MDSWSFHRLVRQQGVRAGNGQEKSKRMEKRPRLKPWRLVRKHRTGWGPCRKIDKGGNRLAFEPVLAASPASNAPQAGRRCIDAECPCKRPCMGHVPGIACRKRSPCRFRFVMHARNVTGTMKRHRKNPLTHSRASVSLRTRHIFMALAASGRSPLGRLPYGTSASRKPCLAASRSRC